MNTSPTATVDPKVKRIHEVLTDLLKSIVKRPDMVNLDLLVKGPLVALSFRVDQPDVPRIIGKQGRRLKSLETLAREALRRDGFEVLVSVDEKTNERFGTPRVHTIGSYNPSGLKDAKSLLEDLLTAMNDGAGKFTVEMSNIGTMMIFEIKATPPAYQAIYGSPVEEEFAVDGHIIRAIKNVFDGIGKTNGRIIRIVLAKP